jgi:hypothetical protein
MPPTATMAITIRQPAQCSRRCRPHRPLQLVGNGQQADYQAEPGSGVSGLSAVCQSALDQRPAGPGVPRAGCSPSPGQDFANARSAGADRAFHLPAPHRADLGAAHGEMTSLKRPDHAVELGFGECGDATCVRRGAGWPFPATGPPLQGIAATVGPLRSGVRAGKCGFQRQAGGTGGRVWAWLRLFPGGSPKVSW